MEYDASVRRQALLHIETHGLAPTHRRIVSLVGAGKHVLDIGCATGYLAEAMVANGCMVTGIEQDADAAETARRYCRDVIVGDAGDSAVLAQLAHAGAVYDVVVCADILEHLIDPWHILSMCQSLLHPASRDRQILVSIPNMAYWRMRWDLMRGRFEYTDTGLLDRTHVRFFTDRTFREMAERCGYRIAGQVINDAGLPGFPHPVDWDRLPVWVRKIVTARPNLCVFHSIYRLVPASTGRKEPAKGPMKREGD
ncbi:class I SAM-dependent methyltransferase [bacterium]|nr:class I SAM-dependent methyltransferase [candidate division CSSED10-310 bacterium]